MKDTDHPLIGIPTNKKFVERYDAHVVPVKYGKLLKSFNCDIVLLPRFGSKGAFRRLFGILDGVMLTGGETGVHPRYFEDDEANNRWDSDTARDENAFAIIRESMRLKIPLLGICRGLQEINVAFGGTLYEEIVREVPGSLEHVFNESKTLEERYDFGHGFECVPGGYLHRLTGELHHRVNSIHNQGILRLAEGLQAEGTSPDGIIEAASYPGAESFFLGVQWHPEWKTMENPLNAAIFRSFTDAVWERFKQRIGLGFIQPKSRIA